MMAMVRSVGAGIRSCVRPVASIDHARRGRRTAHSRPKCEGAPGAVLRSRHPTAAAQTGGFITDDAITAACAVGTLTNVGSVRGIRNLGSIAGACVSTASATAASPMTATCVAVTAAPVTATWMARITAARMAATSVPTASVVSTTSVTTPTPVTTSTVTAAATSAVRPSATGATAGTATAGNTSGGTASRGGSPGRRRCEGCTGKGEGGSEGDEVGTHGRSPEGLTLRELRYSPIQIVVPRRLTRH